MQNKSNRKTQNLINIWKQIIFEIVLKKHIYLIINYIIIKQMIFIIDKNGSTVVLME